MIRPATPDDAAAIVAIYNHYIATTTISFEEHAVTPEEMAGRIRDVTAGLPWLVYEQDGVVLGYAYATKWRARSAYRFAAETSVYLEFGQGGKGIGKALYKALLEELRIREIHMAIGGIAQPNEASVALHESLGFEKVAHFKQVGRKFDRWIDVGYWELQLS
ncbi:phosphinothricin N-acetyltransferase Bar [Janthinobacterium sp. HH01]|uniref:arsinothricin resistance N-acetyltransferase ArsN1 family B n=1 Tax=Oxalobacteraceae TaxID=75682 RepID=UPI0002AEB3A8|nr:MULTISPECIES: arsinothricin resistance N-acetyltransferase ArsN1 family B [Oxalobacteraceae]ELX10549.1 phosphinothricin N-acetyltransferase Bar [Janthinobacterium sp. HH01]OEZ55510.1 phosphinothricin N-acetyltransferase [Duganella sp. HH105]